MIIKLPNWTRHIFNRQKRQLSASVTSRTLVNLVCSGALTVPQGRKLVRLGRPL